jgi:excisionase family DNA binding protein
VAAQRSSPLTDTAGAAEYLGTSVRHIRELRHRGELDYVKVGSLVRYLYADLDAWIAERRHSRDA